MRRLTEVQLLWLTVWVSGLQVVAPLQQGLCDMLAHPGAPDIIAVFNLLSAGL